MRFGWVPGALALGSLVFVVGCSDGATDPGEAGAALVGIEPQGGQVDVPVGLSPTIWFDHPLAEGMGSFAALHRGGLSGPVVDGAWAFSGDRRTLTFDPGEPLEPNTDYTIHVGAGMTDANGDHISLELHGPGMGGGWITASMMTGAMGMGGPTGSMMGPGWAHPTNGSFGMMFNFRTAG